jgi:hypothetical protein
MIMVDKGREVLSESVVCFDSSFINATRFFGFVDTSRDGFSEVILGTI